MSASHEVGDFQTAQTLETFGFLPKLTQQEVYDQIEYLIANGWTPAQCHAVLEGTCGSVAPLDKASVRNPA